MFDNSVSMDKLCDFRWKNVNYGIINIQKENLPSCCLVLSYKFLYQQPRLISRQTYPTSRFGIKSRFLSQPVGDVFTHHVILPWMMGFAASPQPDNRSYLLVNATEAAVFFTAHRQGGREFRLLLEEWKSVWCIHTLDVTQEGTHYYNSCSLPCQPLLSLTYPPLIRKVRCSKPARLVTGYLVTPYHKLSLFNVESK
jgi:hypothetical protein